MSIKLEPGQAALNNFFNTRAVGYLSKKELYLCSVHYISSHFKRAFHGFFMGPADHGVIGQAYNNSFVKNWEYYPLSDNEIKFVMDNIMVVAVPQLLKAITYNDDVIGFIFAFPDISAKLQEYKGKLSPIALINYLWELKRTNWVSFNGVGVLPEYHGRGGNAVLFSEIYKTAHSFNFEHGELTQVAETATQMRKDLKNLGVTPYKNHRIYSKKI